MRFVLDELLLDFWRGERRILRGDREGERIDRISIRGRRRLMEGGGSWEGRRTIFLGARKGGFEMIRFGEDAL